MHNSIFSFDTILRPQAIFPGTYRKKQLLLHLLLGYVKKLPKKKLFEFSLDTNKEELQIRQNDALCNGFAGVDSLQWLLLLCFFLRLCLQTMPSSFLITGYGRKNRPVVKKFYAKENVKVAHEVLHNAYRVIKFCSICLKLYMNL